MESLNVINKKIDLYVVRFTVKKIAESQYGKHFNADQTVMQFNLKDMANH